MQLNSKPFNRTDHHPFKVCGDFNCPICVKSAAKFKIKPKLKEQFFGSSPAPFVGRYGYPNVNLGVLSPPEITEDAWQYDAPRYWSANNFQIHQIAEFRSALINSHVKTHIKSFDKLQEMSKEVGMASLPVEMEISLKRIPVIRMSTDSITAPIGPSAELKKMKITSNPKIPQKVDKVHSDTDLRAVEAVNYLYQSGFDENYLSQILSVGALGLKSNRKLVPTRWSITASDDMIGKQLITTIKDFNQQDNYVLYFGGYLGNYFAVMLFPDVWSYELFETLAGISKYTTDYENYEGRKAYVEQTAGGYYAARLPILERLKERKRQASVLAVRTITDEYSMPLGVFVVREAVRKAMSSKPLSFSSSEMMIDYVKSLLKNKFNHDINNIFSQSKLLKQIKTQKKLTNYA